MSTPPSAVSRSSSEFAQRVFLGASLALAVLVGGLAALPRAAGADQQAIPASTCCTAAARSVVAIGLTVGDMDRALDFYVNTLTFTKLSDVELAGDAVERRDGLFGVRKRVCRLRLGQELLDLTQYLAPEGRPIPVDSRSNDRWFQHVAIIVSDMDQAYARLRERKVRHASSGPQTLPSWNTSAAGIRAFYFKDPDGHVLEILAFPRDKGAARWHANDPLFLGIDHTAIVVADTQASLRFYRDTLGMTVAGESENFGTEQEHLNNVFGARLRITSLRCTGAPEWAGPAIELLEYITPRDGRPFPPDTRANDLWHWQVTIETGDADAVARALRTNGATFISAGVLPAPDGHGFMARDPDGHAITFVSAP